ncbi:hypothetical protein E1J03_22855 [Phocaeicola dorei]|nr:hypothetical protein E1J03_22855 [Phocaeicola dorei]
MTVDSMLCRFKSHYESVRIDSVRHCCEDKEKRLCAIMEALENRRTSTADSKQVPVIVQTSRQEEPKKQRRKGFLGLFGKITGSTSDDDHHDALHTEP